MEKLKQLIKKYQTYIVILILFGVFSRAKPYILPYIIPAATPTITYEGGVYANYDTTSIPSQGDTVLFFHADRCPSCVRAEKNFKASGLPQGLTILKVDYDSHKELRKKYGVRSQTSYVYVQSDGTPISSRVGSMSISDILENIEAEK